MNEWININDKLPKKLQDVYVKTDCENCPINRGVFGFTEFVFSSFAICDKHFEKDYADFVSRITHWMPLPDQPKEE